MRTENGECWRVYYCNVPPILEMVDYANLLKSSLLTRRRDDDEDDED